MLDRDAILNADDLKHEDVEVPEWGGEVRVQELPGVEREAYEAEVADLRESSTHDKFCNLRARLLVRSVIDEKGERVFTNADIAMLGQKSASVLDRLFDIAQELSGLGATMAAELEKNSGADPSGDSPSA